MRSVRVVCFIACLALLCACLPAFAASSLQGSWVFAGYREGNSIACFLDRESVFGWFSTYAHFELKADGSCDYREEYSDGTDYSDLCSWRRSGDELYIYFSDGDYTAYEIAGDMLVEHYNGHEYYYMLSGTQAMFAPNGLRYGSAGAPVAPYTPPVSRSFAGSRWVATGLSTEMIDWIEFDTELGGFSIGDLMEWISFVTSEDELTSGYYFAAVYTTLDLNADGSFELKMKMSTFGQVQKEGDTAYTGSWSETADGLTLTVDGQSSPCYISGDDLIIGVQGMAMCFERVS